MPRSGGGSAAYCVFSPQPPAQHAWPLGARRQHLASQLSQPPHALA